MKKLLLLGLLATFFVGCQQTPTEFVINGTVEVEIKDDTVYIMPVRDTTKLATAKIIDGKFTLIGTIDEPVLAYVIIDGYRCNVLLENDNYTAAITENYRYVEGGDLNDAVFGYLRSEDYKNAMTEYRKKRTTIFEGVESGDLKELKKRREKLAPYSRAVYKIENDYLRGVIESPETPTLTKLYALATTQDSDNYSWERKIELLNAYEKELPNNAFLKAERKSLEDAIVFYAEQDAKVTAGSPFIDFEATTIDGKTIVLGDVVADNKFTLIEFWASWCGPCRGSFPHLKEMYSKYKDKGFEIYGLSLDKDKEAYVKASKEEKLPWIDAVDYNAFKSKPAKDYNVAAIPYTVLIGQDGKIIAGGDKIRGLALEDKLEELFAE